MKWEHKQEPILTSLVKNKTNIWNLKQNLHPNRTLKEIPITY